MCAFMLQLPDGLRQWLWLAYNCKQTAFNLTITTNGILQDQGETVQETVEHKRKSRDFQSQNTELTLTQLSSRGDMSLDTGQQSIYDACEVMPTNVTKTDWEFNREHVNIIKKIGKGAFSQVAKAEAWNINGIKGQTTVAVKMLKGQRLFLLKKYK